MPLSQEPLQLLLEVGSKGPWGTECRCSWSRFSIPQFDGRIDCIQSQGAERLLNVVCQTTESIAEGETPHHWTAAFWSVQIWLSCLGLRRG